MTLFLFSRPTGQYHLAFLPSASQPPGCRGAYEASLHIQSVVRFDEAIPMVTVQLTSVGPHKLCLAPTSPPCTSDDDFWQEIGCNLDAILYTPPSSPPAPPPPASPPAPPPLVLLRVNYQSSAVEVEMCSGEVYRVQFQGGAVQPGGTVSFLSDVPFQDGTCNVPATSPVSLNQTVDAATSVELQLEGGVDYADSGNYSLCYRGPGDSDFLHFANTRIIVLHHPPSTPPTPPPPQSPPSVPPPAVGMSVVPADQCMTTEACIVPTNVLSTVTLHGIADGSYVAFVPRNQGASGDVCKEHGAYGAVEEQFHARGLSGIHLTGGVVVVQLSAAGEHAVCVATKGIARDDWLLVPRLTLSAIHPSPSPPPPSLPPLAVTHTPAPTASAAFFHLTLSSSASNLVTPTRHIVRHRPSPLRSRRRMPDFRRPCPSLAT